MRLSVAAMAAGCATAHAFMNTSPFVMFSTEKYVTSSHARFSLPITVYMQY